MSFLGIQQLKAPAIYSLKYCVGLPKLNIINFPPFLSCFVFHRCNKELEQNQVQKERIYLGYMSWSEFIIEKSQGKTSRQEFGGRSRSRGHGGMLLSDLLAASSAHIPRSARTTWPREEPITVDWALTHQSSVKKAHLESCPRLNLVETFSQLRSPLPRWLV